MSGRQPDYRVSLGKRDEKGSTTIGAAWVNKAGGINIKLNPGLAIMLTGSVDLSLWPPKEGRGGSGYTHDAGGADAGGMSDEDIPF